MISFTYHSPEGDRPLFSKSAPNDGVVDLVNESGDLEIGKCKVESREGGCTPIETKQVGEDDNALESKKVDELRDIAEKLGIETHGLKKADLIEAIETKQVGSETEI